MDTTWKAIIWNQFGAAIDMLENAIRACPDGVWGNFSKKPEWKKKDVVGFWYLVYHTLFFLDYYLSEKIESEKDFAPPAPFTLSEFDPEGALPERVYMKEELLAYLEHCRKKFGRLMAGFSEERAHRASGIPYRDMTVAELLLYNMRHVQHHAAQLNLILRQAIDSAPDWVSKTKAKLGSV
ncbi:MAG: DinB family protein [candidate division Zixibacteria bacterium]|nr:DinB family protein [candidate division Zixibacteria bacterium]MCI0595588.1 DinB family protein [candidate division Zixibacteria bacterium]